jgi:hypothetical protein
MPVFGGINISLPNRIVNLLFPKKYPQALHFLHFSAKLGLAEGAEKRYNEAVGTEGLHCISAPL